jgi:hypothetical protein
MKDMHLWLKTEPEKGELSYETVFCASVIGKVRHMNAGYIVWECKCTHILGNATL